jgi:hypothetical protein
MTGIVRATSGDLSHRLAAKLEPKLEGKKSAGGVAKVVSDEEVDDLVRDLNDLHRGAALETALRIGELIVKRFYGGDLSAWRTHTTKEASFRKLAARADRDLRISATGLWRAVALYELTTRLKITSPRYLTVTHLRLVLGLPDDEQRRLLASAEQMEWPTERLEEETARLRSQAKNRFGRPAMLPLVRVMRLLAKEAQRAGGMATEDDYIAPLTSEQIRAVHKVANEVKDAMDQFQRRLLSRRNVLGARP